MNNHYRSFLKTIFSLIQDKALVNFSLILFILGFSTQAVNAEGSRNLYENGISGSRGNLTSFTSVYGPAGNTSFLRRTLLQVYANQDEYILLGSSAVGITNGTTSGDILVYSQSQVSGRIGAETLASTPEFKCSTQRSITNNTNQGKISNRNQELAGPDTITNAVNATRGNAITNSYLPCYYKVPSSGIYYVAFYGPNGGNSGSTDSTEGTPTGEINLSSTKNFNATQGATVAAWDVTVRDSLTSTIDKNGRLFTDYLALSTGDNGRPMESVFYIVTKDGYQYSTGLNGLDPYSFLIYANDVGFYDSDHKTPLYHNVIGSDKLLSVLEGGAYLALPSHLIFFSNPVTNSNNVNQVLNAKGIPLMPVFPIASKASFTGTAGGNTSKINTGGNFKFESNVPGSYEILISQDGTNFDPAIAKNRVLRGIITSAGTVTVNWDGKDNSGNPFPVGINYKFEIRVRNGEYHFPLLDAENSTKGGPIFTLLNANNPIGNTRGFYDDRGYKTASGTVGTPGTVLCGKNPPTTAFSNYLTGYDTRGNQRAYGSATGGNINTPCSGSFGDVKGLDTWTYISSEIASNTFNIIQPTSSLTADKTVVLAVDSDKSGGITPTPGDILEYTVVIKNTSNTPATQVTLKDNIPTNTTYVPNSLQIFEGTNTGTKTDASGDDQAEYITSPQAQVIFYLGAGANATTGGTLGTETTNNTSTIKFRVKINDPLPSGVNKVSNQAVVSSNGLPDINSNDPSTLTVADPTVSKIAPRLRLVKRITGIKKFGSSVTTPITGYHDLETDINDDLNVNWIPDTQTYLQGVVTSKQISPDIGAFVPDDEVEYTIYFLVDGGVAVQNVNICDFIPEHQTYVPGSIQLSFNGATNMIPDSTSSGSGFYANNFPNSCFGTNKNRGAVFVKIGNMTAVNSNPNTSCGFVRFRAKVD